MTTHSILQQFCSSFKAFANSYCTTGARMPDSFRKTLRDYYGKKMPKGTVRSIPEQLHYDGFGRSHNIVLNEASGFLYAVGSRQGTNICDGGPHIVDIRAVRAPDGSLQPPTYVGCFGDDGYTHDAEVVIYSGPDEEFRGREIMFGCEMMFSFTAILRNTLPPSHAIVSYNCACCRQYSGQHSDHYRHDRSHKPRNYRLGNLQRCGVHAPRMALRGSDAPVLGR